MFQVFTEKFCKLNPVEVEITPLANVQECFQSCQLYENCYFYVYRKHSKECKLYGQSNSYFECDIMAGPSTPIFNEVTLNIAKIRYS